MGPASAVTFHEQPTPVSAENRGPNSRPTAVKTHDQNHGHPAVVLNTSFNLADEPIVSSPLDALRSFYASGLDCLAIGSTIVTK
jgi:hypothetical protein